MTARTRFLALVLATAIVGLLMGVRAVGGSVKTDAECSPASDSGTLESDPLHGSFWRPAGSDAERPVVSLRQVAWTPPESKARRPKPDVLAAVQAVVRFAASD